MILKTNSVYCENCSELFLFCQWNTIFWQKRQFFLNLISFELHTARSNILRFLVPFQMIIKIDVRLRDNSIVGAISLSVKPFYVWRTKIVTSCSKMVVITWNCHSVGRINCRDICAWLVFSNKGNRCESNRVKQTEKLNDLPAWGGIVSYTLSWGKGGLLGRFPETALISTSPETTVFIWELGPRVCIVLNDINIMMADLPDMGELLWDGG